MNADVTVKAPTPGAWKLEAIPEIVRTDPDFQDLDPKDRFWIVGGGIGEVLATVHETSQNEGEANARLFAAALELKHGCQALIGLIQIACSRDDMPAAIKQALLCSHRMDEAYAALAKAEGRS